MSGTKKRMRDISRGINLRKNLPLYGKEFVDVYLHYAALELTFSAFGFFDAMSGETADETSVSPDKTKWCGEVSQLLRRMLEEEGKPSGEAAYDAVAGQAGKLREELTAVMEAYTSYADQFLCYQYRMNQMKFRYQPEEQLQKELNEINEDDFLMRLMSYVFGVKDAGVRKERLRRVTREIPLHMTKGKLFERIHQTLALYRDGDRMALDQYVYILRSVAMLEKPDDRFISDERFRCFLGGLADADFSQMDEASYEQLRGQMDEMEQTLCYMTDFFCDLQVIVNRIYALCLLRQHNETAADIYGDCMEVLRKVLSGQFPGECLEPMEGIIESCVERAACLEAVLPEIRNHERALLDELGLTADFDGYAVIVKLLSDSMFIPLQETNDGDVVDKAVIEEVYNGYTKDLTELFGTLSREMKRVVMAIVLGELPLAFQNTEECMEYFRTNLFGCQNLSEKKAALSELAQMMEEDELWDMEWGGEDDFLV